MLRNSPTSHHLGSPAFRPLLSPLHHDTRTLTRIEENCRDIAKHQVDCRTIRNMFFIQVMVFHITAIKDREGFPRTAVNRKEMDNWPNEKVRTPAYST